MEGYYIHINGLLSKIYVDIEEWNKFSEEKAI